MKDDGRPKDRLNSKILFFVIAVFTIFPSSNTVLCVTPGGHVEIEAFGAGCCAPSTLTAQQRYSSDTVMETASDCYNCTDILISSYEYGVLPKSTLTADNTFAEEISTS
jgi:hypothetical protein